MSTTELILGLLAFGAGICVIMKGVRKFERRRLMVVGEMEDNVGSRVFLYIVLFAFAIALWVIGK